MHLAAKKMSTVYSRHPWNFISKRQMPCFLSMLGLPPNYYYLEGVRFRVVWPNMRNKTTKPNFLFNTGWVNFYLTQVGWITPITQSRNHGKKKFLLLLEGPILHFNEYRRSEDMFHLKGLINAFRLPTWHLSSTDFDSSLIRLPHWEKKHYPLEI